MRRLVVSSLAATGLFSAGLLAEPCMAMPVAGPTAIGVAAADTGLKQNAAVVCGYYGCVRTYPYYGGYYRPHPYYARPYGYYHPYGPYYGAYGWRRW